jgi:transposase, IS5 family
LAGAYLFARPPLSQSEQEGWLASVTLATMLRLHLLQQWYFLSNPAIEEALNVLPTMRRFAGIELISDGIPDETMILTFCHLLEKQGVGEQIFQIVKAHLLARGMTPAWMHHHHSRP